MKNELKFKSLMVITAMTIASIGAHAQTEKKPASVKKTETETRTETVAVDTDGKQYVIEAYNSGMMEIKKSKKISSATESDEIKKIAELMVIEHTALNDQFRALASKKNITLPTEMTESAKYDKMDADKMDKTTTAEKTGVSRDQAYLDRLVASHQKSVVLFEKGSKVSDVEIREVFVAALPKIRHHLEMATNLQNQFKEKGVEQKQSSSEVN